MRTIHATTYVAFDGKSFERADEAIAHEERTVRESVAQYLACADRGPKWKAQNSELLVEFALALLGHRFLGRPDAEDQP